MWWTKDETQGAPVVTLPWTWIVATVLSGHVLSAETIENIPKNSVYDHSTLTWRQEARGHRWKEKRPFSLVWWIYFDTEYIMSLNYSLLINNFSEKRIQCIKYSLLNKLLKRIVRSMVVKLTLSPYILEVVNWWEACYLPSDALEVEWGAVLVSKGPAHLGRTTEKAQQEADSPLQASVHVSDAWCCSSSSCPWSGKDGSLGWGEAVRYVGLPGSVRAFHLWLCRGLGTVFIFCFIHTHLFVGLPLKKNILVVFI